MKDNKKRFIYMVLAGIVISMLLSLLNINGNTPHNHLLDYITSICITFLVWEGNLHIDHWMNRKFPWVTKPGRRILVHLPVSIVFSAAVIYVAMLGFNRFVCVLPDATKNAFMSVSLLMGVLVSIILLTVEVSTQFFRQWKSSLVEIEKYKNESLQAQLQNLKNQLNPHFLFNNMSVLSSLVYKDQDKAVDFINQLSKVYRYLLDNRNNELVSLRTELEFIRSYTYLLQIRFDENIVFDIQVPSDKEEMLLPPMSLQMLIENAIKHNEVSEQLPLNIKVKVLGSQVEVSNNLQARSVNEESSKTGLQNIKDRYRYFTEVPVEVINNGTHFIVKLPLIQNK